MDVKRVRFVDIYEDLEKSLTRWLLADQRAVNLTLEKIHWRAKEFARELDVDNFEDIEWCKRFLDKFCESNNTNSKRNVENLIIGVRQAVTSYVQPIGKVPVHAVGCLSNVIISFSEQVVYNVLLCCMANGTKLPLMVLTNIPFQDKYCCGIRLLQKKDALTFDDCSVIEWLNSMWSLRHNFTYQSHSLLVTNISLAENVKKLFVAAATEIVVVPTSVENVVHPLEKGIKEEFVAVFRMKYQRFLNISGSESITLSSKHLFHWISQAWQSISSDTIATKFQKLGLFYEEEATANTCPMIGFESEESCADHMVVDAMQKILTCNSNNSGNKCKRTEDKSRCSHCKPISRKMVQEASSVKHILPLHLKEEEEEASTLNMDINSYNNNMDDIEIVYVKEKVKDKEKKSKVHEIKCFLCNSKFVSLIDLFIGHNCINLDNKLLDSNDSDKMNTKGRECYYCRIKFEKDIDMLSHVCDYPF